MRVGLWLGVASCYLFTGCATTPPLDNPTAIKPGFHYSNPHLTPSEIPDPQAYDQVYNQVLDALDDYFVIKTSSRYSGTIETEPRTAPGWEQPWKPSTPDVYERLLATLQSIRHQAFARIRPGENGQFLVSVVVLKELEDVPNPLVGASGTSIFNERAAIDRRGELLGQVGSGEYNWIPSGRYPSRDYAFEQAILRKVRHEGGLK